MMLKKHKMDVLAEIETNVRYEVNNHLVNLTHGGMVTMNDLRYTIENAIAAGVREGVATLLENHYSNEEFEQDIGLRT